MRYVITPLCLALAVYLGLTPDSMAILCHGTGVRGVLGSMWFMFVVMAFCHIAPWFELVKGKRR